MKTKILCASCLLFIAFGCGKDGSNPILDVFIPNLSNQWVSSRNTNFFFLPDKDKVNESTFFGNEQDGASIPFKGSYKNYDINFTFEDGPEKGVKYTGKFIKNSKPLRMEVKGSNGVSLVITKTE